jgi:hypothetical protein
MPPPFGSAARPIGLSASQEQPEMIDDIEGFILGLQEHTFQIAEKIASIRVLPLPGPLTPPITEFNSPSRG